MKQFSCAFLLFLSSFMRLLAQEEQSASTFYFRNKIEINPFQAYLNEINLSYERRFSVKRGIEVKLGYVFSRPPIYSMYEWFKGDEYDGGYDLETRAANRTTVYNGYALRLAYKIYYLNGNGRRRYVAPLIDYKYKFFDHKKVWFSAPPSGNGSYLALQSQFVHTIEIGFINGGEGYKFKRWPLEIYYGIGVRYITEYRINNEILRQHLTYGDRIEWGRFHETWPVFHLGMKMGFAWDKKE